jgi:tRNA pseudouridine38-40 synthase
LKKSIRIINAEEVEESFHSRLSCKRKTYRYIINNSEIASAIYRNLETHISQKLNIEKMKQAIKYFEGEHDFKAFKASGTSSKSSVRTIYKAEVIEMPNNRIYIELTGNGFLYNMVRIIAGTLVGVGKGRYKADYVKEMLDKKDRTKAGETAPPQGLTLIKIEY